MTENGQPLPASDWPHATEMKRKPPVDDPQDQNNP